MIETKENRRVYVRITPRRMEGTDSSLSGMANSLNQLARKANESGHMDPDEIRRALAEIHEISTHVKHWWKH